MDFDICSDGRCSGLADTGSWPVAEIPGRSGSLCRAALAEQGLTKAVLGLVTAGTVSVGSQASCFPPMYVIIRKEEKQLPTLGICFWEKGAVAAHLV